ncbi:ribose ABC transporter permease [Thermus scotoductus]|uniref:Ribose ABC transporter permease n=1 Tax=Thermus scotoductus TaxID=37636 RepID=A0A430UX65_THESC|nr:ribose ABC transporter permease [Thermus scotoductus]RTH97504.1 ribose ABC transporter permease [Thermus scotoductus]RTI13959.1 ribose ABC transporter permease [Thermus scotoductus]
MLWARLRPEFLARYGLVWALGILVLVLSLLSPYFLAPSNLLNILRQVSINAVLALGMTVVILKGGIDLSVGSLLALAGAMAAGLAVAGLSPVLAMGLGIGVAIALGILQGLLVAYAGLPPFIVTLAGLTAFRGLTLVYTDGRPITGLPEPFLFLGNGTVLGIPVPVMAMLLFLLLTHFLLRYTAWGRYLYAIGGNEEAARLSGVPVAPIKVFAYAYSGLAAGLAALVLTGRLNSAQPTAGTGFELDAIAAAVVGGTSLAGGRGTAWGTFLGALIIGVLNNGMNLLNVSAFYQLIAKGVVIVLALLVDRLVRRR